MQQITEQITKEAVEKLPLITENKTGWLSADERRKRDESLEVINIPMDRIEDNPFQPRVSYPVDGIKRLAYSISNQGLLNPISVVAVNDHYVIVGGHRRLRAYQRLHRKTIPAIVRRHSRKEDLALDLAMENAMRKDFSPAEKAHAILNVLNQRIPHINNDLFKALMVLNQVKLEEKRGSIGSDFTGKYGFQATDTYKCKRLLDILDMSTNTAIKYLRILDLPAYIQNKIIIADNLHTCADLIKKGFISVSAAYELTRIKNPELRRQLYDKYIKGLNYTQLKFVIDNILEKGEEGFAKSGTNKKRSDANYGLEPLTQQIFRFSSVLWNWRQLKLYQASMSLDKSCFEASLERLRKSAMYLVDATNTKLNQIDDRTKIELINKNLKITIRPGVGGQKFRFGFPSKYGKDLGLEMGDELELNIVAIRKKKE